MVAAVDDEGESIKEAKWATDGLGKAKDAVSSVESSAESMAKEVAAKIKVIAAKWAANGVIKAKEPAQKVRSGIAIARNWKPTHSWFIWATACLALGAAVCTSRLWRGDNSTSSPPTACQSLTPQRHERFVDLVPDPDLIMWEGGYDDDGYWEDTRAVQARTEYAEYERMLRTVGTKAAAQKAKGKASKASKGGTASTATAAGIATAATTAGTAPPKSRRKGKGKAATASGATSHNAARAGSASYSYQQAPMLAGPMVTPLPHTRQEP